MTVTLVVVLLDIIVDVTTIPTTTISADLVQNGIKLNVNFVVFWTYCSDVPSKFEISYQGPIAQPSPFVDFSPMFSAPATVPITKPPITLLLI